MEGINKVRIVLQQASRKMVNRWREVTFAGIVRIPFPVAAPASRETATARTATLFQSVRDSMRVSS